MIDGFQLPWMTVLSKMSTQYAPWLQGRASALPVMLLSAVVIALIWRGSNPWTRLGTAGPGGPAPVADR
jgi:hypothetical protein